MYWVNMKVEKDGKERKLMSFDGDTIGVCNHGLKVVLREVASLQFMGDVLCGIPFLLQESG